MITPTAYYKIEGESLTFLQVRAELKKRFPETAPRITDKTLRCRLQNTMRWDKLGACPVQTQRDNRKRFRTSLNYARKNK